MIQEFRIRFVTCSWVPQLVDALLSMKMRRGETLRSYASRYWELYKEIGRANEKITVSTFRMGLPEDSGLRESLTKKPPEDMRQLMRRVEEYKRLKDDWLQSKGKEPKAPTGEVNVTFKEPVHRTVDKIKHEPYFRWPNRMGGDPSRRNQNLYYTYHKDKGHTTKQCRVLKDHLGQLAKARYLKEFVVGMRDQRTGQGARQRGNPLPPPLGIIEVIHVPSRSIVVARKKGVMIVVPVQGSSDTQPPGKKVKCTREPIAFSDNDLEGTVQPHDNALVVAARISGFLVKRVMIDQGSGAGVMYLDLFKGLRLRSGDLSKYSTPLVEFDGKVVIPEG
nr:uncharacterized protein LOC112033960 [Quercus suber]